MTKLRSPLLSLRASGPLGDALSFDNRSGQPRVRTKPIPQYRQTLLQTYQRWDYQDAAYYWQTLSIAQKDAYRAPASRLHIPIYAAFMRDYLKNLPDLAGRWRLDTPVQATTPDSSKNTNTGTVFGCTPADGLVDGAFSFDGVNDYVNCGNHPSLNITATSKFTWQCLVYSHSCPLLMSTLIGYEAWNYPALYHNGPESRLAGQVKFVIAGTVQVAPTFLYYNRWHHAAMSWDGQYIRVYIDGDLEGISPDLSADTLVAHSADFLLGKVNTYRADAIIDHVAFYNRTLADAQIKAHSKRRWPS